MIIFRISSRKTRILFGIVLPIVAAAIVVGVIVALILRPSETSNYNCQNASEPLDLYIERIGSYFLFSWYPPRSPPECEGTYLLEYDVDGVRRGQANATSNSHMITDVRLETCSLLEARLWTTSEVGNVNENYLTKSFRETPSDVSITAVSFTQTAGNLVITWNVPSELIKCDPTYLLTIYSDLGVISTLSNTTTTTMSYDSYCFTFNLMINAMVDGSTISYTQKIHEETDDIDSVHMTVSPENNEELIVTWDNHPKEELCSITYTVNYFSQDTANTKSMTVTSPEVTFNFTYCTPAYIEIITYGRNGFTTGPSVLLRATQYPEIELFNVSVVYQEAITLISWEETSPIETCNVSYVINVLTDRDVLSENTTETNVELLEDFYCFLFGLQIQPFLGEETRNPFTFDIEYGLSPVFNLELTTEESSHTLIAIWTQHEKQERCGIEYVATFWAGALDQIKITSESEVAFDIFYCTTVSVTVEAVSEFATSEESLATRNTGSPSSVRQVQNIRTEKLLDGSVRISWDPPAYVRYCNIEYAVTVDGDARTCIGVSSCHINLDDPCENVNFKIAAISLDSQPVLGEPAIGSFIC